MNTPAPTDDLRIERIDPLIPPVLLTQDIPLPAEAAELVSHTRTDIEAVLDGQDDRLVVVIGPCSIHDTEAAIEYAKKLAPLRAKYQDELIVIMRVYFEKPRTTIGWKGLINDPDLDDSGRINKGLEIARKLLHDIALQGVPSGTEFLDTITPQYIADSIVWGAIGARTTESQLHRQLASGLSMPVGFKNGTGGSKQIAIDAIGAAKHPHRFLGVTHQGLAAIVQSKGNQHCHIILRGGSDSPNYDADSIQETSTRLRDAGHQGKIMIDCSHANSFKDHTKQPQVADSISQQISHGNDHIAGVMIESHLNEGKQKIAPKSELTYGQSITDACLGWQQSEQLLEQLATSIRERRKRKLA